MKRLDQLQKELEDVGEDMDRMQDLLDEMERLNTKARALDVDTLNAKIDRMMPELGFKPDDDERLVRDPTRQVGLGGGW